LEEKVEKSKNKQDYEIKIFSFFLKNQVKIKKPHKIER
jgi:hypothetical protein